MDWKKFGRNLLFPPAGCVCLLTVVSAAALVWVFVNGRDYSPAAYVIYVFAFYSLTVLCLACWRIIPGYYKRARSRVYENKYANRYLTDAAFKTHINLHRSLVINLLYAVMNAVSAVLYRTHWFAIFAVYYAIMAVMRFLLTRYIGKNQIGKNRLGELRRARLCAYILMTVNLTLSGAVLMMVYFHRSFQYQGFLVYVIAMYTFYITTTAIIDMVRYRKYHSPIMSVSNAIKLAAALVSMLFLETAMFSQFGQEMSLENQRIMIIATGAGISVVVVAVAGYIIVCTTKEIREIRRQKSNDESSGQ